jgi:hypothetical protein
MLHVKKGKLKSVWKGLWNFCYFDNYDYQIKISKLKKKIATIKKMLKSRVSARSFYLGVPGTHVPKIWGSHGILRGSQSWISLKDRY